MQRLGRVIHVTPSRNIVVKTAEPPRIGAAVIDDKLKVIGKVFDIIGPVSAPYAIVKPTITEPEKLSNKQLYLLLSKKERNRKT